ncbi:MAG: hypothetical protein Q7R58_00205 [bacterium]|nr:hypothetical protein [bacterium]
MFSRISVSILGMFVPFGVWNTIMSFSTQGLITFPLLVASLFGADNIASNLQITGLVKRQLFNLVWLLLLTLAVDFVIWGKWVSLGLLLGCPNSLCVSLEI